MTTRSRVLTGCLAVLAVFVLVHAVKGSPPAPTSPASVTDNTGTDPYGPDYGRTSQILTDTQGIGSK